jgi:hypothetical protein
MTIHALIHGNGQTPMPIQGEIEDTIQEAEFHREWQQLSSGLPVAKTAVVTKAFLLYVKMGRMKCQLYLYDAPGEEFISISKMTQQQYFSLLEGFILLVDPLSFAPADAPAASSNGITAALYEVMASTVAAAASGMRPRQGGKLPLRVAVVISKADLGIVTNNIGDVRQGSIPGDVCRKAIVNWGGEHALRALEQHFTAVAYFACSSLGRGVAAGNRQPFQGSGILQPLAWLLTGYSHGIRS